MEQLGALFLRVCTVSAGCSVVLALLLALLPKLREKIAARSLYVLFLVLALRLLLPVELKLPAPAVTVPVPDYTVSVPLPRPAPAAPQVQPVLEPVESPEPAPARKIPVLHVLGLAWALGAAGCALFSVGGFLLAQRRLLRGSVPADADLDALRREFGIRRPVRLVYSAAAPCPLALGLLRPVIVLPAGQLVDELVLRHELTHIRRWDVAYKLVLSLACWVNWFNPLVWLMDRAARRNLELCCDSAVVRGLSGDERRRYGNLLLDASASRPIPFSTCFSGGKTQMKERLLNLFVHKRNSAVLVGLVLAAALLAGGLVACEQSGGAESPKAPDAEPMGASPAPIADLNGQPSVSVTVDSPVSNPENQARRALLKDYFYQNFTEDNASVVLADLTGDGLDEMLVLTMDSGSGAVNLRETLSDFSFGQIKYFGVRGGSVTEYPMTSDVSCAHAGWGYVYLVPRSDGNGFAILDFRPYTGQGLAQYSYGINVPGEAGGEWLFLDSGEAHFSLDPASVMGPDISSDATAEEVQALLDRVNAWRGSGVPLLTFNESYDGSVSECSYLNASPADAFAGKLDSVFALRDCVVFNGESVEFPLPPAGPASPEEALDLLEASLEAYQGGYVFRIPNYDGEWYINVAGRMRMGDEGDNYMSVHYLEGKEWTPGKRYSFETAEGAYYNDLYMFVTVTAPDGTQAERTIVLAGPRSEVDSELPDGAQEDVGSPLPDSVQVIKPEAMYEARFEAEFPQE